MRSSIMSHDENKRQEFKDKTLKRVYDALNAKTVAKPEASKEVIVKGLRPKKGKED